MIPNSLSLDLFVFFVHFGGWIGLIIDLQLLEKWTVVQHN